jgi:hypothetical protein
MMRLNPCCVKRTVNISIHVDEIGKHSHKLKGRPYPSLRTYLTISYVFFLPARVTPEPRTHNWFVFDFILIILPISSAPICHEAAP